MNDTILYTRRWLGPIRRAASRTLGAALAVAVLASSLTGAAAAAAPASAAQPDPSSCQLP